VLVTGRTSGIAEAIAEAFAGDGARVTISGRDIETRRRGRRAPRGLALQVGL